MAHPDRQDTIRRAIALIDTAGPAGLIRAIRGTRIRDDLKTDPAKLRDALTAGIGASGGAGFSAWKGAQQVLAAYGLPT